jgi:hypothetical protein
MNILDAIILSGSLYCTYLFAESLDCLYTAVKYKNMHLKSNFINNYYSNNFVVINIFTMIISGVTFSMLTYIATKPHKN